MNIKNISMLMFLTSILAVTPAVAWDNYDREENPLREFRENSPNYNKDYYNKTYDYNNSYTREDDRDDERPHGRDIRDYNPYYDRDGNLKNF